MPRQGAESAWQGGSRDREPRHCAPVVFRCTARTDEAYQLEIRGSPHAAAYYLAIEHFGVMTQHDYGILGANEMGYLSAVGKQGLIGLARLGYSPDRICAVLSWIDCARFKTLRKP